MAPPPPQPPPRRSEKNNVDGVDDARKDFDRRTPPPQSSTSNGAKTPPIVSQSPPSWTRPIEVVDVVVVDVDDDDGNDLQREMYEIHEEEMLTQRLTGLVNERMIDISESFNLNDDGFCNSGMNGIDGVGMSERERRVLEGDEFAGLLEGTIAGLASFVALRSGRRIVQNRRLTRQKQKHYQQQQQQQQQTEIYRYNQPNGNGNSKSNYEGGYRDSGLGSSQKNGIVGSSSGSNRSKDVYRLSNPNQYQQQQKIYDDPYAPSASFNKYNNGSFNGQGSQSSPSLSSFPPPPSQPRRGLLWTMFGLLIDGAISLTLASYISDEIQYESELERGLQITKLPLMAGRCVVAECLCDDLERELTSIERHVNDNHIDDTSARSNGDSHPRPRAYDRLMRRIERMKKEMDEQQSSVNLTNSGGGRRREINDDDGDYGYAAVLKYDHEYQDDNQGPSTDFSDHGDGTDEKSFDVWDEYRDEMAKQLAFCLSFSENCQRRRYAVREKYNSDGVLDGDSTASSSSSSLSSVTLLDTDVPADGPKLTLLEDIEDRRLQVSDHHQYQHQYQQRQCEEE